jgi:hypothetical protein
MCLRPCVALKFIPFPFDKPAALRWVRSIINPYDYGKHKRRTSKRIPGGRDTTHLPIKCQTITEAKDQHLQGCLLGIEKKLGHRQVGIR